MDRIIRTAVLCTLAFGGVAQADPGEHYSMIFAGASSVGYGGHCSPHQGLWDTYCAEKHYGGRLHLPFLRLPPIYGGHIHYGGGHAAGCNDVLDCGCHRAADAPADGSYGIGDYAAPPSDAGPGLVPPAPPKPQDLPPAVDESVEDEQSDASARRSWWPLFRARA